MNRRGLLGGLVAAIASVFLPKPAQAAPRKPYDYRDAHGRYHARWCYRLEPSGTMTDILWIDQKPGDIIVCHDTINTDIVGMHAHQCLSDPDMSKPNVPVVVHDLSLGFIQVLMQQRTASRLRDNVGFFAAWHLKDVPVA